MAPAADQAEGLWGLLPSGTGSETFFSLRAAGYRGDPGKWSMDRELEPWKMVWSTIGFVCKGYQLLKE